MRRNAQKACSDAQEEGTPKPASTAIPNFLKIHKLLSHNSLGRLDWPEAGNRR
jgi:hypothetical protein